MFFFFHPNVLRKRNELLCIQGDRPRHAIVDIPTAVQGKNSWKAQAKAGDLKPFVQRCFLIFKQVGV